MAILVSADQIPLVPDRETYRLIRIVKIGAFCAGAVMFILSLLLGQRFIEIGVAARHPIFATCAILLFWLVTFVALPVALKSAIRHISMKAHSALSTPDAAQGEVATPGAAGGLNLLEFLIMLTLLMGMIIGAAVMLKKARAAAFEACMEQGLSTEACSSGR